MIYNDAYYSIIKRRKILYLTLIYHRAVSYKQLRRFKRLAAKRMQKHILKVTFGMTLTVPFKSLNSEYLMVLANVNISSYVTNDIQYSFLIKKTSVSRIKHIF